MTGRLHNDKSTTNLDISDKKVEIMDEKRNLIGVAHTYLDPHVDYGTIGEKIRANSKLSVNTPFLSWTSLSSAIGESYNAHLRGALFSLTDAPSSDRASSGVLMSVNLQSMILGTSVLSIPFCAKIAGIWGLLMIVIVGLFTMFTADILSECQYQKSYSKPGFNKRVYVSFVDMAKECWKKAGSCIMKVFVYLSLARNVVVIILLTDIADDLLHTLNITGYDKKLISVIWMLAVIPLLYITKVSVLAWVSFIGLNLYIAVIITVSILCCLTAHTWHFTNISMEFDLQGFGIATGIIINSYAVHMNLPSLEASLKTPTVYRTTSYVSFLINIIAKIGFAICCYLTYVSKTEQEITSNIHNYHPLPTLLRVAVMFFAYFTIPLQSFVVFELIDETFMSHFPACDGKKYTWLFISRTLFMTICLFIAVVIPDFSIVVSLIGSLRGSMISLILPAMFYIRLQTHEVNKFKRYACYVTVVFGTLAAFLGTFASVMAIAVGLEGDMH